MLQNIHQSRACICSFKKELGHLFQQCLPQHTTWNTLCEGPWLSRFGLNGSSSFMINMYDSEESDSTCLIQCFPNLFSLKKTFFSSCLHLFTPKLFFKKSILQGCILIHCCKHATHTIYWEFLKYSVSWMANRFHYPPEINRSRIVEEKEKETSGNEDMKRG